MTSPTGSRLQRPRSKPLPGSSPRPVIPAITPYRSRQDAISYRGTASPTETSATVLDVTWGLCWCGLLPIHPLDLRPERAQPFIDPLVASLDLADIVNGAPSVGGQRRQQHGHAGPDVGGLDGSPLELGGSGDHGAVGVAQNDSGPHADE